MLTEKICKNDDYDDYQKCCINVTNNDLINDREHVKYKRNYDSYHARTNGDTDEKPDCTSVFRWLGLHSAGEYTIIAIVVQNTTGRK